MRIAFLTPEYVEPDLTTGGLANFVFRMAHSCRKCGHEVDVFTICRSDNGGSGVTVQEDGIRVIRVENVRYTFMEKLGSLLAKLHWRLSLEQPIEFSNLSRSLIQILVKEHGLTPYDLVHASDYGVPTLHLPRVRDFRLAVRSSSPNDLYRRVGRPLWNLAQHVLDRWESTVLKQADVCYAPSQFTSLHYQKTLDLDCKVIRPPFYLEDTPSTPTVELPHKYLVHVGNFNRIKGTDVIADALPRAWTSNPDLQFVFVGPEPEPEILEKYNSLWKSNLDNVHWTGAQNKPQVYGMMQNAVATVAPSRVDNFPNVVLESLALETPVIGTRNSSIGEIVEDGITGLLVPPDDVDALASAVSFAWNGGGAFAPDAKLPSPKVFSELEPEKAVGNLIDAVFGSSTP